LVATLLAAVCSMALTGTAAAEAVKCRAAIIKASASYAQARAKALQKCEDAVVKGRLPLTTVCTDDAKADRSITKATTKLTTTIDKACGGADKVCGSNTTGEDGGTALGFPALCPDFESKGCIDSIGTTDCTGIASCLRCIDDAAVDQAIALSYDALVIPTQAVDDKTRKALKNVRPRSAKPPRGSSSQNRKRSPSAGARSTRTMARPIPLAPSRVTGRRRERSSRRRENSLTASRKRALARTRFSTASA